MWSNRSATTVNLSVRIENPAVIASILEWVRWKTELPPVLNMNKYKKIGILGGMGPEATADLYMKIVKYFQKNYGARYDKDFPEFFINSVPIPDVVESMENEKNVLFMLLSATKLLQKDGCDFIVIACNSVQ